ncbi:CD99 antigen [Diceros bicornis minor]|uniref:CD99 antigen n=1 Tax=Diceros bicornis minor TaxID=77932 RepID=UPI0026F2DE45|nr:CD99 antigen [Diceros bicornis minor]
MDPLLAAGKDALGGVFGLMTLGQYALVLRGMVLKDDKKPKTPPHKNPSADNDLNLEDAIGGDDDPVPHNPAKPRPDPKPRQPGSGGFPDSDLADGTSDGGGGHGESGGRGGQAPDGERQGGFSDSDLADGTSDGGESPGVVPGIVGAVLVAVAGAISSFIAYQKKKFCFKENADQGEVDMENHHSTNAEPPVQRTLLEK